MYLLQSRAAGGAAPTPKSTRAAAALSGGVMYLLRSRADGGGDGSDGKCTASGDCIVGILRFLTITVDVKLRLAQLLGMSWLKSQNSRIEETNISANGMTDTAGQYPQRSSSL